MNRRQRRAGAAGDHRPNPSAQRYAAPNLEVLRRLRLRLEAENPAPAGEIWTVKRLMFIQELTAAYDREGRHGFTDAHGTAIGEKYGVSHQSPEISAPEIDKLLARSDLNEAEKIVLGHAAAGLRRSRRVMKDYAEGAITAADVMERIEAGLRPKPVLNVGDGLPDGSHRVH